jgi:hypothetical protein
MGRSSLTHLHRTSWLSSSSFVHAYRRRGRGTVNLWFFPSFLYSILATDCSRLKYEITPHLTEVSFRKNIFYISFSIPKIKVGNRMPPVGIQFPISLPRPYISDLIASSCAPCSYISLFFTKFHQRRFEYPVLSTSCFIFCQVHRTGTWCTLSCHLIPFTIEFLLTRPTSRTWCCIVSSPESARPPPIWGWFRRTPWVSASPF